MGDEFNRRRTPCKKEEPRRKKGREQRMTRLLRTFAAAAAVVVVADSPLSLFGARKAEAVGAGQLSVENPPSGPAQIQVENLPDEAPPPYQAEMDDFHGEAPEEQLPQEPSEVYRVCSACRGSRLCQECHNNGYVQCEDIRDGCARCLGSGVRLCNSCAGAGHCAACGGTGMGDMEAEQFFVQCSACEGRGILCPGSAAADDPEGCHGSVAVHCLACGDTGHERDGTLCSWCKGTLRHLCPSFEYHRACPACAGSGMELGHSA